MKQIGLMFFCVAFLASCTNYKPFTKSLQDEYQISEKDLRNIQFYLSEDVTLSRELSGGSQEIIKGSVKIIDGKKYESIIIKKGTPGVLAFSPKENRFAIQFEDRKEAYLMFGPNPKYGNRYMLLASDWSRSSGKVTYEGAKYTVRNPSQFAALMIDLKKVDAREVNRRTAKGVKIN